MKKDFVLPFLRDVNAIKHSCKGFWGYTLAEIIIVILIIAVIVSVTIGITRAKLNNIVSYTYYSAYSTLRTITSDMLVDWKPTDPEYKQALSGNNIAEAQFTNLFGQKLLSFKDKLLSLSSDLWSQPALAAKCASTSDNATSCRNRGYYWCSIVQLCYSSSSCCNSSLGCNTVGPDKETCSSRGGIWCLTINGQEECVNQAGCCKQSSGGSGSSGSSSCPITSCPSYHTLNKSTCKCVCSRNCDSGYKLNTLNCKCEPVPAPAPQPTQVDCWDGSKADSSANCPPKI